MASSTWSSATPAPSMSMTDWWRRLGRTGLTVSAICLGGPPQESRSRRTWASRTADTTTVVHHALAQGITFLDPLTGGAIGSWQQMDGAVAGPVGQHGSPVIATTLDTTTLATSTVHTGRAATGWVATGWVATGWVATGWVDTAGHGVRAAVDASAHRLGLPRLPLVYLHLRPLQPVEVLSAPGGPLDTLVTLRAAGEIGAIGVAGSDIDQLRRCVDLGVVDVIRVHSRWTLLDRTAASLLDHAAAAGVAVVNADIFAGGLLYRSGGLPCRGGDQDRPVGTALAEAADAMDLVCRWWGTDLTTAALLFSVRDHRVTSTVTGCATPAEVTSTLNALDVDLVEPFWDELDTLLPPHDH